MQETQDLAALPLAWILILILLALVFCIWATIKIAEAAQKRALSPQEKLIGQIGRVLSPVSATQRGKVRVFGEIWDALTVETDDGETLAPQTEVRVVGMDNIDAQVLRVTRLVR